MHEEESLDKHIARLGETYARIQKDFQELNQRIESSSSLLQEKNAELNAILDTTVDAIIMIDTKGIIHLFNATAEKLFGYSKHEIIGQPVNLLMPPHHAEKHDGYIKHYVDTGERHIIGIGRDEMAKRKNGELFPINLAVNETWIGDERFFTGILRDLTQYRALEEESEALQDQLQSSQKMTIIGTLISQFVHDLRNFMTPIEGFASILSDKLPEKDKESQDAIREIQAALQRAQEISNQLIAFVRKEEKGATTTPIDLSATIANVKSLIRASISKRIEIEYNLAETPKQIIIDPLSLQQIIMNLAINARDAMPKGGTLTIATREENDRVLLSVTDTGTGMDEKTKAKIFDVLFTTKEKGQGTGLGLAMVKDLVEKVGGTIDVTSAPNQGTTFTLSFPIAS